ncbi:hypothetical protein HNY73_014107 [Argiope bruennichi]|uniref:Uncharacterized protein n=1 Tax=Argiope bruennichi TaxID=94029 RepID=A0A8T0ERX2_ARGBR|nr:hypothetical protein HNY73_014107 [Argiope bruennichi]
MEEPTKVVKKCVKTTLSGPFFWMISDDQSHPQNTRSEKKMVMTPHHLTQGLPRAPGPHCEVGRISRLGALLQPGLKL